MQPEKPQIPKLEYYDDYPIQGQTTATSIKVPQLDLKSPTVDGKEIGKRGDPEFMRIENARTKHMLAVDALSRNVEVAKIEPVTMRSANTLIVPTHPNSRTAAEDAIPTTGGLENHMTPEALQQMSDAGSKVLDYPEHFEHNQNEVAIADTSPAELNEFIKRYPEHPGFSISGGDLAKMGDSRLTTSGARIDSKRGHSSGAEQIARANPDETTSSRDSLDAKPIFNNNKETLDRTGIFPVDSQGLADYPTGPYQGLPSSFYLDSDIPNDTMGRQTIFKQAALNHLKGLASRLAYQKDELDRDTASHEANAAADTKAVAEDDSFNNFEAIEGKLKDAHGRGAHKGRKFAACPSC